MKIKLILLVLLIAGNCLQARWEQCNNGLYGGMINCLITDGNKIYAGTTGNLYRSTDGGKNWLNLTKYFNATNIINVAASGEIIFIITSSFGMYFSTDEGVSWQSSFLKSFNGCLLLIGDTLFAGNSDGIYKLPVYDQGNWSYIPKPAFFSLCKGNNILFGGTDNGLYSSVDNGSNWEKTGHDGLIFKKLLIRGNLIFGASDSILYKSSDNGLNWSPAGISNQRVLSITSNDELLYVLTDSAIYFSSDNGADWERNVIPDIFINYVEIVCSGNKLLAGSNSYGMFSSEDNGVSWSQINKGISDVFVNSLFVDGNNIIAATNQTGISISTNNGNTWFRKTNGLGNGYVSKVIKKDKLYFVVKDGYVFKSSDMGLNWEKIKINNDSTVITDIYADETELLASAKWFKAGIYISTDNGLNWQIRGVNNSNVYSVYSEGNKLFAGTANSVFISEDNGLTWVKTFNEDNRWSVCKFIKSIGNILYTSFAISGLFYSADGGLNWSKNNGINSRNIEALVGKDNNLYAAGSGLFVSTDIGNTWADKSNTIAYPYIPTLAIKDNYIFAGTDGFGIYRADLQSITSVSETLNPNYNLSLVYCRSQEKLLVKLMNEQNLPLSLTVYNLNGHQMLSYSIPKCSLEESIDVSCLTTGVYIVVVGDKVMKFIKE